MKEETNREEIKEFISNTGKRPRKNLSRRRKRKTEEQVTAIAGFVLMTVIFIVVGIFACKMPVVLVCVIALLEVLLAKCFYNLPIFLHILVVVAQIVAGVIGGQVLFALLAALVYFISVIVLCYLYRT